MATSSIFASQIILPATNLSFASSFRTSTGCLTTAIPVTTVNGGLAIECSSRPQKKATAHHRKTRPRKTQPWDVKRKPTVYAPLPALPAEWTIVASADNNAADVSVTPPPA